MRLPLAVFALLFPLLLPSLTATAWGQPKAIDAPAKPCARPKFLFQGRCMSAKALARAHRCPAGSRAKVDSNEMFHERWCEQPDGSKIGDHLLWINVADATGHLMRWARYADDGSANEIHYHSNSHQPHHVYKLVGGKINGPVKVYDPNGKLREVLTKLDGQVHGLAREFDATGKLTMARCVHMGQLVWKSEGQLPTDKACPPKGFSPAALVDNRKQVLFSLPKGEHYPRELDSLARYKGKWYVAMQSGQHGSGIFLATPGEKEWTLELLREHEGRVDSLHVTGELAVFHDGYDIKTLDLSGSKAARTLAEAYSVQDMAVHGKHVYFVNNTAVDEEGLPGGLYRVALAGGKPQRLAKASERPRFMRLAIFGDHVYWTDEQAGTIHRTPKAGGATTVLATGYEPLAINVDKLGIYWSELGDSDYEYFPGSPGGVIMSLPLDGSGKPRRLVGAGEQAIEILCDAKNLYWRSSYGLMRLPRSGGPPQYMIDQTVSPRDLLLVGKHLYWVDSTVMEIVRIHRQARDRQFGEPL